MSEVKFLLDEDGVKTADNQFLNISGLNVNELWQLEYEQTLAFAGLIKKAKPFSDERNKLMKNGYETTNKIKIMRNKKQGKHLKAFGANYNYVKLVNQIISKILSQKDKCIFFEAGVGTGMIVKNAALLPNVTAIGCDTYIDKNYIDGELNIHECTIFEALNKLEDNNIDLFYWNDVIEHIPEDEIEEHIELLCKKLAAGGIVITITPNRLKGPSDITKHFHPPGTIAKGFHFHEYTFQETIELFEKYKVASKYSVIGKLNKGWYLLCPKWIDKMKITIEKAVGKIPCIMVRKIILYLAGTEVSILMINKDNPCANSLKTSQGNAD